MSRFKFQTESVFTSGLSEPYSIDFTSRGNLVVADTKQHKVHWLGDQGEILFSASKADGRDYEFGSAMFVYVNRFNGKDSVVVVDRDHAEVCMFDKTGKFVRYFSESTEQSDEEEYSAFGKVEAVSVNQHTGAVVISAESSSTDDNLFFFDHDGNKTNSMEAEIPRFCDDELIGFFSSEPSTVFFDYAAIVILDENGKMAKRIPLPSEPRVTLRLIDKHDNLWGTAFDDSELRVFSRDIALLKIIELDEKDIDRCEIIDIAVSDKGKVVIVFDNEKGEYMVKVGTAVEVVDDKEKNKIDEPLSPVL